MRMDRDDNWQFDPRLSESRQTGHPVCRDNPLDKGHTVRRLGPVRGDRTEAATASADTDILNQGKKLWLWLEDFLLGNAKLFERKLSVSPDQYRRIPIPPTAASRSPSGSGRSPPFIQNGHMASTAHILDQTPGLSRDAAARAMAEAERAGDPPPGSLPHFQVPVADVAETTGPNLGSLPDADLLPQALRAARCWAQLESYNDITLHP
jgi:endonuclease G